MPHRECPERPEAHATGRAPRIPSEDRTQEALESEGADGPKEPTTGPELHDLRVEERPIASLALRRSNPRTHSEKQIRQTRTVVRAGAAPARRSRASSSAGGGASRERTRLAGPTP